MSGTLDVSVVITSYNTSELTRRCIRSIDRERAELRLEVIVVDNASRDDSVQAIRDEFPWVIVIANDENVGFASANNIGFLRARGRYVLVLNPDTEVEDLAIAKTLEFAEASSDLGAVGCRVFREDGSQSASFFRFIRLRDIALNLFIPYRILKRSKLLWSARYSDRDLDQIQDVDVIAGCFMLVPRQVLETVGAMDGDFFMYGEESEWCHRIRSNGFSVLYFPGARIMHVGGAATSKVRPEMLIVMARSQLLLMEKIRGWPAAYAANLMMLLREIPRCILWLLLAPIPGARESEFGNALGLSVRRTPMFVRGLYRREWAMGAHARTTSCSVDSGDRAHAAG